MKIVNESLVNQEYDEITIRVRKNSGKNLLEILDCIKGCGNAGHSFDIIIDPETKENIKDRTFFWDGDGSDFIKDIKMK